MRPCGLCKIPTPAHVLIGNSGICNTCYDRQAKKQRDKLVKLYTEYRSIDRRRNATNMSSVRKTNK